MALGKRVRVWTRNKLSEDAMGEPVWDWDYLDVENVLVRPLQGSEDRQTDAARSLRPDEISVEFRLAFPKTYRGPKLAHARISLIDAPWSMDIDNPDDALLVAGYPQPEDPCPTQWNMLVEVGRKDG
ncbi:MAG: hypothetical protein IJ125_05025 [Atopobiaceae bacterium]|nr:hypothetical protein [Atopobiaceae bacterium]